MTIEATRELSLVPPWSVDAEDVDAITRKTGRSRNHKDGRKAKQLCRQVAETLELVLSGDCREESLLSLHVVSVVPAPNTSRLLVTVTAGMSSGESDPRQILELLERQTGRLRGEVASSINRKRVPSLAFAVVGPSVSGQ